ncbi:MAG TPA: hypothetical protein VG052_12185 [Puia sp.]|jgi:hypothetical protein|nr:hypothetical protein [Puia sp.]
MKTTFYRLLFVTAFTGVLFSCNKSSSNSNAATSNTDLQTTSDDQTQVSSESDAAFDDANIAMATHNTVTGASLPSAIRYTEIDGPGGDSTQSPICDATISVDSTSNPRTITITYNGTNCALNRSRTGSIVISIDSGIQWRNPGAVATVTFNNLTITSLITNKKIIISGTHTYTNVSGGSLISLPLNTGDSIIHTITSNNMAVTFSNNTQRTWNVARRRVFTYNGGYVISTSGTGTVGSTTGVSEWGEDRFGSNFQVAIVQPRVISESCGWQMTSGEVEITNTYGVTTVTYGLNASGVATGCPVGSATYYFELSWVSASSGKTYTFIMPY